MNSQANSVCVCETPHTPQCRTGDSALCVREGIGHTETRDKRPLLRGYVSGQIIHVYCPSCDAWHTHGWITGERKPSHRVAHCGDPEGTFYRTGYYVAPFTVADRRRIAEVTR